MHFTVYALDHFGAGERRAQHRDAHRQRLQRHHRDLAVVAAGPLLDQDEKPIGSLLIIEAATIDAVRAFVEDDPYRINGVYETIDIRPFTWTIGAPPAGA